MFDFVIEQLDYNHLVEAISSLKDEHSDINKIIIFAPIQSINEFEDQAINLNLYKIDDEGIKLLKFNILNVIVEFIPSELLKYEIFYN